MRVTLLQTDIAWADPETNIRRARQLFADHPGSDLYVLPEMWSTGFVTDPVGIAQPEAANAGRSWMEAAAHSPRPCAVCGSVPMVDADGRYRNRHYFFDGRTPAVHYYDKHHLFTYGHEDRYYTPGSQRCRFEYAGVRFQLLTCYDLRFPVWSRYTKDDPFDVTVVVANWPENRQAAWQILTRARAVENQCFLIGVNRVGSDPYSHYRGCSCVVDCYGKTLGQCRPDEMQALTVDLDIDELRRRRSKFRVLDDADTCFV